MQDPIAPISLNLNHPAPAAQVTGELQFQHAEPVGNTSNAAVCVACKKRIDETYFHAAGQVVCPVCTHAIQAHLQAPPPSALPKAVLYGAGAAVAASAVYAAITVITGVQIGLVALVVGYVVAKAILHATGGRGGRAQQVLAVLLTYFAITTSYVPVALHRVYEQRQAASKPVVLSGTAPARSRSGAGVATSLAAAVIYLVVVAAAAPFLQLSHGSGFLSLVIIAFAIFRAWRMTAGAELVIMGPYTKNV